MCQHPDVGPSHCLELQQDWYSAVLQYLQLAWNNILDVGRIKENPVTRTNDFTTHSDSSSQSPAFALVPQFNCQFPQSKATKTRGCLQMKWSAYRRGILTLKGLFYKRYVGQEAHLPFPWGEDMESLFQDCLLYKHSWKNKVKKGSQCLCSRDVQKHELSPQN